MEEKKPVEQVEETTTQPETNPENTEVITPTEEEKSEVPSFSSLEEYNKFVQSTSSKAKGELLKEIGYEKVADIKEAIEKGKPLEEITEELNLTKTELAQAKEELERINDEKLLETVGIPKEDGALFLKLVKEDTSEDSIEVKAERIVKQIAKMVGVTPKIGSFKTPSPTQDELYKKEMKDLQKL